MGILDLFQPSPLYCPVPDDEIVLDDILPPQTDPPPPPDPLPTREALLAAAVATAAAIMTRIREDEDCEDCEECLALAQGDGGIPPPPRMPYPNTSNNLNGYEFQHYIVFWYFHDAANRIIMEFELAGVWFDGLDHTGGTLLAQRAVTRSEYDPSAVGRCYLIDTKYGYNEWFRYNVDDEEWEPLVPSFMLDQFLPELRGQLGACGGLYPNVFLIWIASHHRTQQYFNDVVKPQAGSPAYRVAYAAYQASH